MQISQMLKNLFAIAAKEKKNSTAAHKRDYQRESPEAEAIKIGQAALRHCPGLLSNHYR